MAITITPNFPVHYGVHNPDNFLELWSNQGNQPYFRFELSLMQSGNPLYTVFLTPNLTTGGSAYINYVVNNLVTLWVTPEKPELLNFTGVKPQQRGWIKHYWRVRECWWGGSGWSFGEFAQTEVMFAHNSVQNFNMEEPVAVLSDDDNDVHPLGAPRQISLWVDQNTYVAIFIRCMVTRKGGQSRLYYIPWHQGGQLIPVPESGRLVVSLTSVLPFLTHNDEKMIIDAILGYSTPGPPPPIEGTEKEINLVTPHDDGVRVTFSEDHGYSPGSILYFSGEGGSAYCVVSQVIDNSSIVVTIPVEDWGGWNQSQLVEVTRAPYILAKEINYRIVNRTYAGLYYRNLYGGIDAIYFYNVDTERVTVDKVISKTGALQKNTVLSVKGRKVRTYRGLLTENPAKIRALLLSKEVWDENLNPVTITTAEQVYEANRLPQELKIEVMYNNLIIND